MITQKNAEIALDFFGKTLGVRWTPSVEEKKSILFFRRSFLGR